MRKPIIFAALGAMCVVGTLSASAQTMPDFAGLWARQGIEASTFEKPPTGPGPVMNTEHPTSLFNFRMVGDYTNPILQPWVAAIIKKNGEDELAGHAILVPHNACWPEGVPSALNLRENVQFLQTPNLVTIVYQRDHQYRQIFLNQAHSKNYTPSWYGESVGHYEGDTLVVDTVGIKVNTHSFSDGFGSPHSAKLHVVERYRVINGGRDLQASATVEDPDVFTMPWVGMATYRKSQNATMEEIVCAENNRFITGGEWPIPTAAKSDF